jgi:hypothetical protein
MYLAFDAGGSGPKLHSRLIHLLCIYFFLTCLRLALAPTLKKAFLFSPHEAFFRLLKKFFFYL